MKIRNGFVSNSSSSSFIIMGVKVSRETLKDIIGNNAPEEDYILYCGEAEQIINKMFCVNLAIRDGYDPDCDEIVIGKIIGSLEEQEIQEIDCPDMDDKLETCNDINKLSFLDKEIQPIDLKIYGSMRSRE